ncbi:MAG: HEAT repeat domain-containing protein [Waterburya sp.]
MICDRFAFVIIYIALSGFKPSHSWAAKPTLLNSNVIHNQTTLPQDVIDYLQKKDSTAQEAFLQVQFARQEFARQELAFSSSMVALKQQAIAEGVAKPIAKPTQRIIANEGSVNPQPVKEETKESKGINRLLPLGGMALTSAFALFLISVLFTKPQQKPKLSTTNENLKLGEASAKSDAVVSNLIQDNTLAPLGLDITGDNSWELEKSLVLGKVSLSDSPLVDIDADIDVVQELMNDLQHPENYPHSNPESYPLKYSDLEHLESFAESSSPEISIRRKAIEKLAEVGDHRSIEALLNVMPQVCALEKSLILQAITQINQRTFQSINNELFIALGHENPQVRLSALRDLRNLYQFVSPVITEIAKMQSDQDYEIRITAIQTLRQLNANPLPTFDNYRDREVNSDHEFDDLANDLTMGTESDNNLHLVAYLLAELDAEK